MYGSNDRYENDIKRCVLFLGKYIFSINKITVNTNTFIIYQWLVIVWKWQNYRNGLPDHLKYLQMHCETSLLKKQNEYYRQNCDLAHKVTFQKNYYNKCNKFSIEFFICFIFIYLLQLITHSAIQDIDIVWQ